jgi:hypothetical protein
MKELINKIKEFLKDKNTLEALWYISCILWFGFVGRIIIVSDLHIIVKIIMIIGDLWWGFYVFMSYYESNKE